MSFIIYKASAGSGKTFNLAKEYLKIVLLNPDDFVHILAITFTNKAANEMKTRIIDYLSGISSLNPDGKGKKDLLPLLVSETKLTENEIILRSGIILRKILYRYADFSIMTIDKFFQKIIRSFSYDLNIPINFRLEINLDEMIEQIVDNLLELVGENKDIDEILIQYINKLTENNKSWHIEKNLSDFSKEIFKENAYLNLKSLQKYELIDFIEIINNLKNGLHEISKEINIQANISINQIKKQNIQVDDFSYKSKGIGQWFHNVLNGEYSVNSYVTKAIFEDSWFSKNKEPLNFSLIKTELTECGKNIIEKIKKYNDLSIIFSNIYGVALVNQIKNVIQKVKEQEGMFFLSETNFTLSEVIKNQPTPFIYERIGEKYHHYFIDEFQDTSKLQWNNLIPLVIEAISSLHDGKNGTSILFGDAKQSIYRFRDADFMQFVELPKLNIDENDINKKYHQNILSNAYTLKNLNYNFRTKAKIVEFNNQLFEISKKYIPDYQHIYENHNQETIGNQNEGLVDISLFENFKEAEQYVTCSQNRILSIINDLIESNYDYKDIAILGRDKNHLRKIATFLISNNIRVISSDSLQLETSADVRFLVQMIHFFKSNNNELINTSIIKYLAEKNSEIYFSEVIRNCKNFESMKYFFTQSGYIIDFQLCYDLNIYDLCEEIIRIFFKNKDADSYVIGLLDVIHKYHIDQKSESEFYKWWEEEKNNYSIALPEGIDGVRILTIHAAKGLEYPVVIIPNFKEKKHSSSIWVNTSDLNQNYLSYYNLPTARVKTINVDKISPYLSSCFENEFREELQLQQIDDLNIAYVALTRPIDRLYIISELPSNTSLSKSEYTFSKLLFEYTNLHQNEKVMLKDEEFDHYQIGYSLPKTQKSNKINHQNMIFLQKNITSKWYETNKVYSKQQDTDAIEWGLIFHFTMQNIFTISDLENAISKTKFYYNMSAEKIILLKQLIELTCNNSLLIKYFSQKNTVLNERSILDSNGDIYRPDRIILQDEFAIVIDFKTGTANEKHLEQITHYKSLLIQLGYKNVKSFIVYVQLDKVDIIEQ